MPDPLAAFYDEKILFAVRQQFYRTNAAASLALELWLGPTSKPTDLLKFERLAEAAQRLARRVEALENLRAARAH